MDDRASRKQEQEQHQQIDKPEGHGSNTDVPKNALSDSLQKLTLTEQKVHTFWDTQPVAKYYPLNVVRGTSSGDSSAVTSTTEDMVIEGPIEPAKDISEVRQDPYPLPSAYEWCVCDVDDDVQLSEIYTLLTNNYVEDDDSMFRFDYSRDFLRWALQPPGYFKEWIIGVRAKASRKLVALITGVPARIRANSNVIKMAEINFLCVHKKLRSKRLAPVLIKEVTRKVHLRNIWQAAYTGGALLPTPIAQCQYWHRSLNPKKLIDVGFSRLGHRMTMNRTIKLYKLPEETVTPGLRVMQRKDVPAVSALLASYLKQFNVAPVWEESEVGHMLLPVDGVVDSFVVEDPISHEITDFCSFYTLPSTIIGNSSHSILRAAYSFYNVAKATPLLQLLNDLLILAKQKDYDVFNALDLMHNMQVLKDLKFGAGDGYLHYYIYNYQLQSQLKPSQLGLVLL